MTINLSLHRRGLVSDSRRPTLAKVVFSLAALSATVAKAMPDNAVTIKTVKPGTVLDGVYGPEGYQTTLVRIDRPMAGKLRNVTFAPGDQVWIGSQGCIAYHSGMGRPLESNRPPGSTFRQDDYWFVTRYSPTVAISIPGITQGPVGARSVS